MFWKITIQVTLNTVRVIVKFKKFKKKNACRIIFDRIQC